MCGIWALFGAENDEAYCACADRIAHRGPDASRFETNEKIRCSLAFHRLQIVGQDIKAMQPMRVAAYPHVTLLCNGEIYNHETLSRKMDFYLETGSDCEVIIHLYTKVGIKKTCVLLDGVFAFILVDTREMRVFLARDPFGVRPMFYFLSGRGILGVSSELKGLVDLDVADKRIEVFPPSHLGEFTLNGDGVVVRHRVDEYHNFGCTPQHAVLKITKHRSASSTLQNIRLLLTAAVEKRLMSQRPVGAFLSGGLDSSLVAAIAAKKLRLQNRGMKLQTFSIGFPSSPDLIHARKVARFIDSDHHEFVISHDDAARAVNDVIYATETYDVNTLRPSIPMYLLSKNVRKTSKVVVILSGEGADELAQGYTYFHHQPSPEEGDKESRRLLQNLHLYDILRTDRCTSHHGLEVRVPFLDHAFTSYYLSLPKELRCPTNGYEKYLLRLAFQGTDLIPSSVLWRGKVGFGEGMAADLSQRFGYLRMHLTKITHEHVKQAKKTWNHNPPRTKEEVYYRRVFESSYGGKNSSLIPDVWKQKWVNVHEEDEELTQYSNATTPKNKK